MEESFDVEKAAIELVMNDNKTKKMQLAKRMGIKEIYFSFVCDLEFIQTDKKRKIMQQGTQVLVKY